MHTYSIPLKKNEKRVFEHFSSIFSIEVGDAYVR